MFVLVEAARIELASENLFMQLSTSVFYLLKFPMVAADKRAEIVGSPDTIERNGHSAGSFTANQRPISSRGILPVDGSRLRLLPVRYF